MKTCFVKKSHAKIYRITRVSKDFVWVRWEAFGAQRRGLSTRIPIADFRLKWIRLPQREAWPKQTHEH